MKTSEHAADAAALETPYLSARREWNERYGDYIARARSWRWAAFGAIAVALALAIGVVWQGAQSKVVPYVVEVDKLGDADGELPGRRWWEPAPSQQHVDAGRHRAHAAAARDH